MISMSYLGIVAARNCPSSEKYVARCNHQASCRWQVLMPAHTRTWRYLQVIIYARASEVFKIQQTFHSTATGAAMRLQTGPLDLCPESGLRYAFSHILWLV